MTKKEKLYLQSLEEINKLTHTYEDLKYINGKRMKEMLIKIRAITREVMSI